MTKPFKRFWQVLLLAGIICLSIGIWRTHRCPHLLQRAFLRLVDGAYSPGGDITFKWELSSSGTALGGGSFDDSKYQSSDCVSVDLTTFSFPTPDVARQDFNNKLQLAYRVLEQTPERNVDGQSIPERAIISMGFHRRYGILRLRGNKLTWVESDYLGHALEFERRFPRTGPPQAETEVGRADHP